MNRLTAEIGAGIDCGDGYPEFRELIARRVARIQGPLFTTSECGGLFNDFLQRLSYNQQHYNCYTCARFLEEYGGLVALDEAGQQYSPIWDVALPLGQFFFLDAYRALNIRVKAAKITGVFVSDKRVWGTPETPPWTHLYGRPPEHLIYKGQVLKAHEKAAEYRQDFLMLRTALYEYSGVMFATAVRVLQGDQLYQHGHAQQAEWLRDLHRATRQVDISRETAHNRLWRAVATAPAGWCHVKSGMLGSLYEDLRAGLGFDEVKRRWDAKMHPLQYRRPQTVSDGNIEQAERLVERLGLAPALRRRFATMADVQTFWLPTIQDPVLTSTGVFEHLRPKLRDRRRVLAIPPQKMTWLKFVKEMLAGADKLEVYVTTQRQPFAALVTAADPGAPNLLQWDPPVSWYLYHQGSRPGSWGLPAAAWVPVKGIVHHPACWRFGAQHIRHIESDFALWLLEGCRDLHYQKGGGFFPSMLKSEYHGIRSTLEAYAKEAVIEGVERSDACGLLMAQGREWNLRVRVNGQDEYLLDRWD